LTTPSAAVAPPTTVRQSSRKRNVPKSYAEFKGALLSIFQ
jgi:hypothetical protein